MKSTGSSPNSNPEEEYFKLKLAEAEATIQVLTALNYKKDAIIRTMRWQVREAELKLNGGL